MKRLRAVGLLVVPVVALALTALAQRPERPDRGQRRETRGGRGERDRRQARQAVLPPDVEQLASLSAMLGRPTDRGITASVLSAEAREAFIEYGTASDGYPLKTEVTHLPAGIPVEVTLKGLEPDTAYVYRLRPRRPGEADFAVGDESGFHTQRAVGSTFVFQVQGDSHPERPHQYDPTLYAQTLRAAAADRPDFYLTIGDDFSVDKLRSVNRDAVEAIYLSQRWFLGLVGRVAPVFLVNGNHEQAAAYNLDGTPDNVAVWAQTCRNRYFPQPAPDGFYSGDKQPVQFIGLLRDYYAWTWGDALFVVIDPYWHSAVPVDSVYGGGAKTRDRWDITLGDAQYHWLRQTLEGSGAKHKFVFAHHVLGTGRGGIELAGLYEWGGRGRNGAWEFDRKRPGWELPIHQLMAQSGVTIFFQGHDHIFARQELDGVVYQTLPEPADPNYALYNQEAYRTGDVLPNSGRVRVTVSPEQVTVEYVRSYLPADEMAEQKDGEVAYSYSIRH